MNQIRIITVDDHQLIRDGIRALLKDEYEYIIINEASNENDLLNILTETQPDIILMDISLPGKSGVEICKDLSEKYPEIKIIILSMYLNEDFILNALKSGAKGYLPKNTTKKELIEALKTVHAGKEYFNNEVSEIIIKSYMNNVKKEDTQKRSTEALTSREKEILKLFAEGQTNKEIAENLFISIRTVESHKNNILHKLELKSTVELIKYAIKNKLVEL